VSNSYLPPADGLIPTPSPLNALACGIVNGVFIGSLVPHIAYGIALGVLLERYIAHQGSIVGLTRDALQMKTTSAHAQRS